MWKSFKEPYNFPEGLQNYLEVLHGQVKIIFKAQYTHKNVVKTRRNTQRERENNNKKYEISKSLHLFSETLADRNSSRVSRMTITLQLFLKLIQKFLKTC